jgi:hypothetical protein
MATNDDDTPAPEHLRLVGIIGGLRPQASVADEPALTLLRCSAYQLPSGAIHLAGHCVELAEGRSTTAIVAGDATARRCVTTSGRQYALRGPPAYLDSDAAWVWEQFQRINGVTTLKDVSEQLFDLLQTEP